MVRFVVEQLEGLDTVHLGTEGGRAVEQESCR